MSQKALKEKKEIEIDIRRTMCDLCGEMLKDGAVKFRLITDREEYSEYDRGMRMSISSNEPLDICSVDCLKENINGLAITLQSKIIPTTPESGTISNNRLVRLDSCKAEEPPSAGSFTLSSVASALKLRG